MTDQHKQVVHQALHGYRDGHTLIASSTELPRHARAEIQRLSDRSGPGEEPGFESYLTAYPVAELASYAFARTWSAPEMSRPGCVWTHTLFVPNTMIGKLDGLDALLPLFRRPGSEVVTESDGYHDDLGVPQAATVKPRVTQSLEHVAGLLAALYGSERPVLLESNTAGEPEALFLSIWAQQWKHLRQRFMFCTGALAPRTAWGKPMDLQAVPSRRGSRVQRDWAHKSVFLTADVESDAPNWAFRAARVLAGDLPRAEFSRFLHTFGDEPTASRTIFPTLVDAFLALGETELPPEARLEQIGSLFPIPEQAKRLKRSLLGDPRPLMRDMPALEALLAVYELDDPRPYAARGVADGKRLLRLWEDHPGERTLVLTRWTTRSWNQLGNAAFEAILSELPQVSIADALAGTQSTVIHVVIARRPDIIGSHRFWELSDEAVAAGIEGAASADAPAEVWRTALAASERLSRSQVWTRLSEGAVDPLVRAILESLKDKPGYLHPAADIVLSRRAALVWSWMDRLADPIEPAALLLSRFGRIAEAAVSAGDAARRLARRAAQAPAQLGAADTIAAVLLGVALTRRSDASRDLIETCFGRVHAALEAGRLNADAHAALGRSLFPGANGVGADALRRRLVERYEAERWGWAPLVHAVAGGSVVDQLLKLFAPPPKRDSEKKK